MSAAVLELWGLTPDRVAVLDFTEFQDKLGKQGLLYSPLAQVPWRQADAGKHKAFEEAKVCWCISISKEESWMPSHHGDSSKKENNSACFGVARDDIPLHGKQKKEWKEPSKAVLNHNAAHICNIVNNLPRTRIDPDNDEN
jgi:hypothetical protein